MPEESRSSARVSVPYIARLWSLGAAGRPWKEDTVLDNISAGGLYLRLKRHIQEGAHVHVAVRLSTAQAENIPGLRLAAHGVVLRTESQPGSTCGVAVEFSRRRIL